MKEHLTCVTLSKQPFHRESDLFQYLNYCSIFSDEIGNKKAHISSLKKVTTPYCFYCDDDDPVPEGLLLPKNNIVYGDFIYTDYGVHRVRVGQKWDFEKHIDNHWLIHKPIITTKNALLVIDKIPDLNIHFHFVFYFLLSYIYGSEYNPNLKCIWNKQKNGHHLKTLSILGNSQRWLFLNAKRIKEELTDLPVNHM